MAHFAQLDDNNVVLQVIVVDNTEIVDSSGKESEELGITFCQNLLGGNWVQTSYNGTFRKNYAYIDSIYDSVRDAFIEPQPYPSWSLNEDTCLWEAPIPHPEGEGYYKWNEELVNWELVT